MTLSARLGLVLLCVTALSGEAAWGQQKAGVAAAVRGRVEVQRGKVVGREVASGDPIFLGDEITTGPKGGLQILLLDETVFTMGADSTMVIDEFVYDPESNAGRIDARLAKGVFRFVTGKIAREEPASVNLRVPAGNIGIRGTMGGVRIDPVSEEILAVLLGPGPRNDASERQGAINVSGNGVDWDILATGWGSRFPDFRSPPEPPFRVPETLMNSFDTLPATALRAAPTPAPSDAGAEPASRAAGAITAQGQQYAGVSADLNTVAEELDGFERPVAPAGQPKQLAELLGAGRLMDGLTTVQELIEFSSQFSGRWIYRLQNVALSGGAGSFSLGLEANFGRQEMRFLFFNFFSATYSTFGGSFAQGSRRFELGRLGKADFRMLGVYNEISSACPCLVTVDARLFNEGGKLANSADIKVGVTNGFVQSSAERDRVPIAVILP